MRILQEYILTSTQRLNIIKLFKHVKQFQVEATFHVIVILT